MGAATGGKASWGSCRKVPEMAGLGGDGCPLCIGTLRRAHRAFASESSAISRFAKKRPFCLLADGRPLRSDEGAWVGASQAKWTRTACRTVF